MDVRFGHLDFAYFSLSDLAGEGYENDEYDQKTAAFDLAFQEVKFPTPLDRGQLIFRRTGRDRWNKTKKI